MALNLAGGPPPTVTKTRTKTATPKSTAQLEVREEGLNGIGQIASFLCLMTSNIADAGAIATHGPGLAHEAAVLAETNKYAAKGIDLLVGVGPFAAILAAAAPLLLQIAVNHKKMPASPALLQFGVQSPETMEAQARIRVMEMQAEMAKAEREAQTRLSELQREATSNGE